jgi:peptide/nickel transport system ATP-binding protein
MSLLQVRNLAIEYQTPEGQRVRAVEEVSFDLAAGQTLGIVGESGCGKSTLARALLGHLRRGSRLAAGCVLLDGEDLFAVRPERLRQLRGGTVALMPQQPLSALTPHLRAGDQVAEVMRAHAQLGPHEAAALVLQQFAQTKLPEPALIAQRFPHQISGGQRQRVAIAAALAGAPSLLVLDEPTTALDKTTEVDVLALIGQLQARLGTALIYVSHDLRVIRAMCARVLVMKGGRILEDGPTQEVFDHARSAYTRSLVAAMPDIRAPVLRCSQTARSSAAPLLSIEAVTFHYPAHRLFSRSKPDRAAVQDVSFSVGRGESFGLVGESGSGKSTLAGLISGLVAGAQGRILFDGKSLQAQARRRTADLRRRIQLVFQDPVSSLNPAHSVETILCRPMQLFFALGRHEARTRAIGLLGEMELDPQLLSRRPAELSGGQQQRVALARAFAADPDLIICDEVTSALDVTVQAQVVALLQRLQRERDVTFVYISHDLGFIHQVADRIVVLRDGSVCETGATDDLLRQPRHPYTQALVAAYRGHAMAEPLPARAPAA